MVQDICGSLADLPGTVAPVASIVKCELGLDFPSVTDDCISVMLPFAENHGAAAGRGKEARVEGRQPGPILRGKLPKSRLPRQCAAQKEELRPHPRSGFLHHVPQIHTACSCPSFAESTDALI